MNRKIKKKNREKEGRGTGFKWGGGGEEGTKKKRNVMKRKVKVYLFSPCKVLKG